MSQKEQELSIEEMLKELTVDYYSEQEMEIQAVLPVPDRLHPKHVSRKLVSQLKLSQKIGLLVWMNRNGLLSIGGRERLLYLQRKAPEEALLAGIKFSSRVQKETKLQSDFLPHMRELNRRPQSRRFRLTEKRRIGVGYRDKGSLPDQSSRARSKSHSESFLFQLSLPTELLDLVRLRAPLALTEDGWVDLSLILGRDFLDEEGELIPLPSPL